MKRTITYILAAAAVVLAASSCWREEIKDLELGSDLKLRHEVTDLKAVPGDGEVALSWAVPEGWNPTKFIVTYTNPDQSSGRLETAEKSLLVADLANRYEYTFNVQALYGEDILSGVKSVSATPVTSRIAVAKLNADSIDGGVVLSWTKPSETVQGYKLTYYMEDTPADVKTVSIAADKESYTVDGLTNDKNYLFSLVGVYPKGESEPATVKAMPMSAQAFFVSREKAVKNQPVRFRFNTDAYPTATNVFWEFPGGIQKEGNDVEYAFSSPGEQQAILHATIGGAEKTWKIGISVREWGLHVNDFPQNGTNYAGFKGSCPVFSPDGKTVYNITFNKKTTLLAYDTESGEKKWEFEYADGTNQGSYNMCTVNPVNGDIYYGTQTGGSFVCVTAEGLFKWVYKGLGSMQSAAPAVNKAGDKVFAIDAAGKTVGLDAATGAELWTVDLGGKGGGILVYGDEVVVGTQSKTLAFLNAGTGAEIAKLTLGANMTDISGFGISKDRKTAYFGNTGGGVSSVDLEGRKLIVDNKVVGTNNMYEPVVGPDGNVFYGSKDGFIYLLDKDLTLITSIDSGNGSNAFNYSHPVVDTDGNYYITAGGQKNQNFKVGPTGNLLDKWQYEEGDKQMGGNNYLDGIFYSAFIGATGANGYFIGDYVGGTRYDGHGFDICGSCCVK